MKSKQISDLRSQISKYEKCAGALVRRYFLFTDHRSPITRGCLIWVMLIFAAATFSGCASKKAYYPARPTVGVDQRAPEGQQFTGVYHTVKEGQTLWRISKAYGVDLETLQWVNDVEDVTDLRVGRVLFIPGVDRQVAVDSFLPEEEPSRAKVALIWPVKGRATSGFGPRGNRKHEGIDLAAPRGTPVLASATGKVAYSGNGMRGYGKVIVLKHANDLSTVYAHNSSLLVRMGDEVRQGQVIAKVGATGRATGPHLHFEIRRRGVPEDPRRFLSGL